MLVAGDRRWLGSAANGDDGWRMGIEMKLGSGLRLTQSEGDAKRGSKVREMGRPSMAGDRQRTARMGGYWPAK